MSETPDHTMEPIWFVQCTYAPDALETRGPYRPIHLDRCAELKRQGVVVEAGAYGDLSASVLLIRAATEADALEICRQDVYMQNGIWVELRARPFSRIRLAEEGEA